MFPTALNAVALDPGEYALYVGGADGRIFITALNYGVPTASGILNDGLVGSDAALIGHRCYPLVNFFIFATNPYKMSSVSSISSESELALSWRIHCHRGSVSTQIHVKAEKYDFIASW